MVALISSTLFWGAVALIGYTYIGFPLLLMLRGLLRPRSYQQGTATPSVSVLLAVYNEEAWIVKRLQNLLEQDYPAEKLEIIVASDGSSDNTEQLVRGLRLPNVRLLSLPRQGKNGTLNSAAAVARNEILVFTDADSLFTPGTLRKLVAPFSDATIGAVGGDFRYDSYGESHDERAYWGLDRWLKRLQRKGGDLTSATGQIYALRRELFTPIPANVNDDFYASTRAVVAGRRLLFEPQAVAHGPISADADAEFRRKVRVISLGLAGIWASRELLNPFRYGFYSIQLWSHKVFRRLLGAPLVLMLVSAWLLWPTHLFYQVTALGETAFYGLALLGYMRRHGTGRLNKLMSIPYFFTMVNLAGLKALSDLLRGREHNLWVSQRAVQTVVPEPEGGPVPTNELEEPEPLMERAVGA
jgi:glycosyltransferase involved in cell wall biosynthesis